jgi:hypothetical protein
MKRVLVAALLALASAAVIVSETQSSAFQRQACGPARPSRLIVHERGRVAAADPSPVNVREGPRASSDSPIGRIPVGGVFYVLEGPECSPLYNWYRVEYRTAQGELLVGWIAEGSAESYFVETYPPGE